MCNQLKWSYYLLVKLLEMVLLDKMVQPLVQPSKLASGTTENDLTWKVSQAVKMIPLVIIIQLVKMVQPVIWIQSVKIIQPVKRNPPLEMIQLIKILMIQPIKMNHLLKIIRPVKMVQKVSDPTG